MTFFAPFCPVPPSRTMTVDDKTVPVVQGYEDDQAYDAEQPAGEKNELLGQPAQQVSGARHAYFNTVCMMMGVGVLGLPATVAKGGWVMLAIIPVLVVMACYSGRLLIDGLYIDVPNGGEKCNGYPEYGFRVLGWFGLGVTHFTMKTTLLTVSGVMAFLGSTLARTAIIDIRYGHAGPPADLDQDALLKHAIIAFTAASLLPTMLLPTLREVSILSFLGAAATLGVAIVVIVVGFADSGMNGSHEVVRAANLGDGFGTIVLGLGGASTFPSIERQMVEHSTTPTATTDRKYKKVLVAVFASLAAVYLPVSFTGYYVYGGEVAGLVVDSLPRHGAYLTVISILNIALACHCFVTHSLIVFVLAEEFERRVFSISQADLSLRQHMCSFHTAPRLLFRAVCVLWTFLVAYFVPNFLALCDLTGSFCAFTVFVLPCSFALAADYQRPEGEKGLGWPRRIWIVIIIVAALVGFVFGFKSAVKEIHDAFGK
eukprot:TRINITY_DN3019_c0_g1_i2.p2 TRINITY_DN3019_c0_g1~~TRINITY_DN3019_c0_g1_i2.p2  ORF type:complete len:485 (+),score=175.55 TRINITY_DN3019_c0_g1_i2:53-1507(+)